MPFFPFVVPKTSFVTFDTPVIGHRKTEDYKDVVSSVTIPRPLWNEISLTAQNHKFSSLARKNKRPDEEKVFSSRGKKQPPKPQKLGIGIFLYIGPEKQKPAPKGTILYIKSLVFNPKNAHYGVFLQKLQ